MNLFKTLALVGLVGVGMAYGEDSPQRGNSQEPHVVNILQFKGEYEKVIKSYPSDRASALEGFSKLRNMYFLIDFKIKELKKNPLYAAKPTMNVGIPGIPVSGMDPDQVPDPKLKKAYQDAIRNNNTAIEFSNYFIELVNTKKTMFFAVKCFLNNNIKDESLSKKLLKELPSP